MGKLYTMGYAGWSLDALVRKVRELDAILVDIRHSPSSRNPAFSGKTLGKSLGHLYQHCPGFGNKNYKGGPIELADVAAGMRQVKPILAVRHVILLCMCGKVESCHRKPVADLVIRACRIPSWHDIPAPAKSAPPTQTSLM